MNKLAAILLFIIFATTACQTNDEQTSTDKPVETALSPTEKLIQNNEPQPAVATNVEVDQNSVPENVPHYKVNESNWSLETTGNPTQPAVLMTIDDAPDQYALEMARKLARLNVKAIFFVNGHFLNTPEKEEQLREIHRLGFQIGNHTNTHRKLNELSEQEQYEEIVSLNNKIEGVIGERPKFFRAPFGGNTDYSKKIVDEQNMVLMNWSYGFDWEADYRTADSLADVMVNTPLLADGANLLMHDRQWTNEALENIVTGLQQKGYSIIDPATIETQ
ncbi:polysaccharide deacetylase [Bacillus canaveralius]|uniref:Polysaccharide deacetylase n=1 Tax=Bacillus canaveralius TaxID=1403243 RepID=A0A2N5GNI1_9BACI|nr:MULTISPECIES: polysaccharide deacetylase family protein [Bacillus]PLR84053.1 polysaccharide deacetylase [Bacillus canaveralius]PLR87286.1 polysaccharide deacetylase [Bacillus sp. V33-4]PLR96301.1 polysaccharide deacetylase [Bacillus canaveralius]